MNLTKRTLKTDIQMNRHARMQQNHREIYRNCQSLSTSATTIHANIRLDAYQAFKEKLMVLQDLKDFLSIFMWWEFWIVVGCAFLAVGTWVFVCFALIIPNTAVKTIVLWGFIFLLSILGGLTEKSQKKAISQ